MEAERTVLSVVSWEKRAALGVPATLTALTSAIPVSFDALCSMSAILLRSVALCAHLCGVKLQFTFNFACPQAWLVSEKFFFSSPISKHPRPNRKQQDIKLSGAYWLRENKVLLLERTTGLVRFHEVDFDSGDDLIVTNKDRIESPLNKYMPQLHLSVRPAPGFDVRFVAGT